jgi:hypothetical protein
MKHRDIPEGWRFVAGTRSIRVLSRSSELIPTHTLFLLQRRLFFFWWSTVETYVHESKSKYLTFTKE